MIDAARFFSCSTDYLLGITQITTPKSYDISELGLSEEPVKRLITGRIDINILNCLLEHEHFPRLCIMIRNFFDGTIIEGVMARNQVVDFAVDQLTDLMNAEPAKRKEIIKDKQFLNWQKLGLNEADIEKADTDRAGMEYTVRGTIGGSAYYTKADSPLIEERADPYIVYDEERQMYYFTASYPVNGKGGADGYDRLVIREAKNN